MNGDGRLKMTLELFISDFEEGDGSEWDTEYNTPSYSGSYAKNGSYGMKCDSDAAAAGDYVEKISSAWEAYEHLKIGFWFQLKTNLAAYDNLTILGIRETGVGMPIQVNLAYEDPFGGNVLRCYTAGGTSVVFNGIAIDTWYYFEVDSYIGGNTTFRLTGFSDQACPSTAFLWNELEFGCVWRGVDSGANVDVWFDDFLLEIGLEDPSNPYIMNSGGIIDDPHIIDWQENQIWDVAIRDVPTRTTGQQLDTDTKVINPKQVTLTIRISASEKTTLQAIVDANESVDFINQYWGYTAWILTKKPVWKYVELNNSLKPWETVLTMLVISGGGCPSGEQMTNGGFETGDWTGWTHSTNWSSIESGGHSGSYEASMWRDVCSGEYGWIQQVSTMRVYCISKLEFYAKHNGSGEDIKVSIGYSNGTVSELTFAVGTDWTLINLLSSLTAGLRLSYIKVEAYGSGYDSFDVDDFTMLGFTC